MDTQARTTPASLARQSGPGGRGGKDLPDALRVETERAQRHVAVVGIEHHVLDVGDFNSRDLAGRGAWTRRTVIEAADGAGSPPGVVARDGRPRIRKITASGNACVALVIARRMLALTAPSGSR